jgi:LysM repeat protein
MNLRLTRRGRAVLLLTLVTLLLAAFSLGRVGSQASPKSAQSTSSLTQTVVQPGESLWAVAKRVAPGHDPRAVIDQLADLNHLQSSSLQAGQLLVVPSS